MNELVIATQNLGKLREIAAILSPIHCIGQHTLDIASPDETGLSFIENALIKARFVSHMANKPALADDSGLVVRSLSGRPGIYSARFAGPHATDSENINKLLALLTSVEPSARQAYFYCAIALVQHADDPTPIIATGRLDGIISQHPTGSNGFGYDPVFYLPTYACSMAQLAEETKNTISHRAIALCSLKDTINSGLL